MIRRLNRLLRKIKDEQRTEKKMGINITARGKKKERNKKQIKLTKGKKKYEKHPWQDFPPMPYAASD